MSVHPESETPSVPGTRPESGARPGPGMLPDPGTLIDPSALVAAYYREKPDPEDPAQRVSFGTSGHRGSSFSRSFNEEHIAAVTQAVCDARRENGVTGPLFLGMDTHALSEPAFRTALEVLTANGVTTFIQKGGGFTPTPAVSRAVLAWNRAHEARADGIVVTPSHNPPADGGFKYNPPTGGPADAGLTRRIEERANELLRAKNAGARRAGAALKTSSLIREYDFLGEYVRDLAHVVNMRLIAASGLRLGADPLGGSSLEYWEPAARAYGIDLVVTNPGLDPAFSFIPLDHDGKIRMDCSSPWAMAGLLKHKDSYDLAFGCDPDADRHGIVTPRGLMNPNHYLSVAARHLFRSRPDWPEKAGLGKTVVTSAMLERAAASEGRGVVETPVGFKWFVPFLLDGTCGMGCEESAGATFLRFDGSPWTTDKDGIVMCFLAAEITAATGKNPAELYAEMEEEFGPVAYGRCDMALSAPLRALFAEGPEALAARVPRSLNGEPVTRVLTKAPGNGASIGGVKVLLESGWFAARPSGTEPVCKVYSESFQGEARGKELRNSVLRMLADMAAGE